MDEGRREVAVDHGTDALEVGVRPIGIVGTFQCALCRNPDQIRVFPTDRGLADVSPALLVVAEEVEAVMVSAQNSRLELVLENEWHWIGSRGVMPGRDRR
jgi:hypothetical protein